MSDKDKREKNAYEAGMADLKVHYEQSGKPKTQEALHREMQAVQEKVAVDLKGKHELYK